VNEPRCAAPIDTIMATPALATRKLVMDAERCPVCDNSPRVLIAITHPAMRRLILELLDREHGCWQACLLDRELDAAMHGLKPDLVIIDGAAFPHCCYGQPDGYPRDRIVVVGPEPDTAYMTAALRNGAGGWVARDDIADRLSAEMRRALGCIHGPCPSPSATATRRGSVDHHISVR
jgi:DNA-binding NarL/FixJ family response regulator